MSDINDKKRKFADTLSSLLNQDVDEPILAKKILKEEYREEKTKRKNKLQRKRRMERKLLANRGHVPAQFDDVEKKLLRISTKGVVSLFNAITKHQKALNKAVEKANKSKAQNVQDLSKDGFLSLLKKSTATTTETTSKSKSEPKWKALQDDFMLKANPKDWNDEDDNDNDNDIENK